MIKKIVENLENLAGKGQQKETSRLIMEQSRIVANIAKNNGFHLINYQGLKEQKNALLRHISKMENDLIFGNLSDFEHKTKLAEMHYLTRLFLHPKEYQSSQRSRQSSDI